MTSLNYHHLRYFREVAREGHLGRTAERLNISQSALSIQIRALEERMGHKLFDRVGRGLELTEVGKIALNHADRIFSIGADLTNTLGRKEGQGRKLSVGALSTLSRNFQLSFLRPLLQGGDTQVNLRSGGTKSLLADLENLELDIVLTTEMPPAGFEAHAIAQQAVGLQCHPDRTNHASLSDMLRSEPLILPTDYAIRPRFDGLISNLGVTPNVAAEVDDMAMIRLLTRENIGVAVAPAVVLADEIASGHIVTAPFPLDISEPFYAVTKPRSFPHPKLAALLAKTRN